MVVSVGSHLGFSVCGQKQESVYNHCGNQSGPRLKDQSAARGRQRKRTHLQRAEMLLSSICIALKPESLVSGHLEIQRKCV